MPALVEQHKHPSSFTTRAVRPTTRQEHQTGTSNVGSKQLSFHVQSGSNQVHISLSIPSSKQFRWPECTLRLLDE